METPIAPDELQITIRHEDGAYWATSSTFPGVFATGDDLAELRASLEEGIALWLAEPGRPAPSVSIDGLSWDEPPRTEAHADLTYVAA